MTDCRQPLAAVVAVSATAAMLVGLSFLFSFDAHDGLSQLSLAALWSSCAVAGLALSGAFLAARPAREALALGPGRLSNASVAILACGIVALSHLLDVTLRATGLFDGSVLEQIESTLRGAGWIAIAFATVCVAAAPGIGEELLFRGLMLQGLRRRFGSTAALIVSSIAFGALHGDLAQGLGAALVGLYLGVLVIANGSIRAAIACHAVNNAAAIADAVWSEAPIASAAPWWLNAGAGVVLAAALLHLARCLRELGGGAEIDRALATPPGQASGQPASGRNESQERTG